MSKIRITKNGQQAETISLAQTDTIEITFDRDQEKEGILLYIGARDDE